MRALVLAFALAACAQSAAPPSDVENMQAKYQRWLDEAKAQQKEADAGGEAKAQDTCGMAAYERHVGRPASEIDRARLPPRARIITPDAIVTQDFSAQRLNIFVGTDGIVGSLRCF
jgi:hypothetical protein